MRSHVEQDYETAKMIADKNLQKIINEWPRALAEREERIFEELSSSREPSLKKLENIYAFLDDLLSFVANYTPCRKGCSYCCYMKVAVSPLEAEYIQTNLRIKQRPNLQRKDTYGTPCPFLKDGACSIYEYRPFVCRRHLTFFDNPRWCQLDLCDKYIWPLLRCPEVETSYRFVISESGDRSLYDIRQLFQYE